MRTPRKLALPFAAATALLALTGCPILLDDEFRLGAPGDAAGGGAGSTASVPNELAAGGTSTAGSGGAPSLDPEAPGCAESDCSDACPDDPDKLAPGACGCGVPETAACGVIAAAPSHRYRFDGSGTEIRDSIGTAHATLVGTTLDGSGEVDLTGGSAGEYVDLPNGIVASLTSATFELWLLWHGGSAWQRIFDFGSSTAGEDVRGNGVSYLFLSPQISEDSDFDGVMRLTYSDSGGNDEVELNAPTALPSERQVHVAVVVDAERERMLLYQDGELLGSITLARPLSALDDVNDWLGRSQFTRDPGLDARLLEFRIYAAPLDADAIRTSFQAGPDAEFFEN